MYIFSKYGQETYMSVVKFLFVSSANEVHTFIELLNTLYNRHLFYVPHTFRNNDTIVLI